MGSLLEHKPIHDLYLYGSTYYVDPTNYLNNKSAAPIAYNPNCWIKDPQYNLPSVDFSGISIRTRGSPTYGFDSLSSYPDVQSSGALVGYTGSLAGVPGLGRFDPLAGTTCVNPIAINFFKWSVVMGGTASRTNPIDQYQTHESYYSPGRPIGNVNIAKDWKNWNCGYPCGILISPKHVITTAHFIGAGAYGSPATFYFLGKDNVQYALAGKLIYKARGFLDPNPPINPPGFNLGSGPDIAIFELDKQLTIQEQEQLKIYKILDEGSIYGPVESSSGTSSAYTINDLKIFWLWNQGFVTVMDGKENPIFDLDQFPDAPVLGGTLYNDGITGPGQNTANAGYLMYNKTDGSGSTFTVERPDSQLYNFPFATQLFSGRLKLNIGSAIWVGDSGTPRLIYVPSINDVCYMSTAFGAGGYVDPSWNSFNTILVELSKFWINLKNYIYETTSPQYNLQFIKYSNLAPPRPKYKQTIHVNGITYYAKFETPVYKFSGGNTGQVNLSLYLTPGATYSFAVAALSKSGAIISEPATLNNVNFPSAKPGQLPNLIP